jgi:MFS family permease
VAAEISRACADAKPQGSSAGATSCSLGYEWYVVFVLMACYTLSFIDRQILSLLVGPIKRDLAISDTQIGLLQGLAFSLFYALLGLPIGRVADSRNRRNLIGASVIAWSFFTAGCSAARSFSTLFLSRIGVGVGEAGLSPSAYSMISDYFPKESLAAALSVFYMGVFIGASLALVVGGSIVDAVTHMAAVQLPLIGLTAPWRLTFLIVAAPGIVCAALLCTVREPLRKSVLRTPSGEASKLDLRGTFAELVKRWQSLVGICVGMLCQSTCVYGFLAWSPTFFVRVHHWTPGQAGRALGPVIATAGCSGMYVGGRVCERWLRNGVLDAPLRVALPAAVGAAILFPIAFTSDSATTTLGFICAGLFFVALPMATTVAALQLIFPNQLRGQVSALLLFFLNLGGLTLGPLAPGLLNDHFFHEGSAIGRSLAITIGVGAVLMLVVFCFALRPYRSDYRMMHAPATDAGRT